MSGRQAKTITPAVLRHMLAYTRQTANPVRDRTLIATHPQRGSIRGVGSVIRSARGGAMRPNSIVNWFVSMFAALDLPGCSSHSGRRTFITTAARNAHRAGCSLRDVQLLAGHRSIETTQRYIDGNSSGQRKLVALM
jgi:integrase/recombinase XerD